MQHRLDDNERQCLETDGYLLRTNVFSRAEVAAMIAASETLVGDLVRDRQGRRHKVGSYTFDPDLARGVMIKWEGESDVVHGIEPFAHLSPALHACAARRLIAPEQRAPLALRAVRRRAMDEEWAEEHDRPRADELTPGPTGEQSTLPSSPADAPALSSVPARGAEGSSFPRLLRAWCQKRRLSQPADEAMDKLFRSLATS